MALDTTVNSQITDSVTQTNVKVIGEAPALALSNLYQNISQSLGLDAQNAVAAQQDANMIQQGNTTPSVNLLYLLDPEATGLDSE